MANRGRPSFVATDKQRGEVETMHGYGIPEQAIADKPGISKPTLRKHFEPELKNGATTANIAVADFLFSTIGHGGVSLLFYKVKKFGKAAGSIRN